jgi:hypothetical protein
MKVMLLEDPGKDLRQGDILRNIDFPAYRRIEDNRAELSILRFPRAVVLSQDCDIASDLLSIPKGDIRLVSVLMAPLYEMSDAAEGNHLKDLGMHHEGLRGKNSGSGQDLRNNANPRYHCLPLSQAGIEPDLIADFKHYFAVSCDYLRAVRAMEDTLVASLNELYREDLCQRFAAYLTRIGLPTPIRA